QILDLAALRDAGVFKGEAAEAAAVAAEPTLNRFMGLGQRHWSALRRAASDLLADDGKRGSGEKLLVPMRPAGLKLPAAIAHHTHFSASVFHAPNTGRNFRPDNPLLPNYKWVPIAYHGRASSIVASGAPVRRPNGQRKPANVETPDFGPSRN